VEFHHQGSVIAENKNAQNNALSLFSFSLTRKNRKKTGCGNPTNKPISTFIFILYIYVYLFIESLLNS
jgi:hypothetical protein